MNLSIYKRGQGKYTRLGSASGAVAVMTFGCLQLYRTLEASDLGLWISTMVPVGILLALSVLFFWLVNEPNIADFLIASEGEMKKVNWSSKQEIAVSTFIVISVVIILAVILGAADYIFQLSVTSLMQ
jgi:preprotein translocase SecE subunit